MSSDTMMDVRAVADFLGIKPSTVYDYHKKNVMPKADTYFGRSPAWKRQTIDDWSSSRPRKGKVSA